MPQADRHKNRTVPIEFNAAEPLCGLPYPGRYTLVLVTSGGARAVINGVPAALAAPCVLCLTPADSVEITHGEALAAVSFSFHPDFFNTIRLDDALGLLRPNLRLQTGLTLFEGPGKTVLPPVTAEAFPRLFEWIFVLGTEVAAQSDSLWVCRIKKYLIQALGLLEDLSRAEEFSPVDAALAYIHAHYQDKILVEDLTARAHLNRVSLNEGFRARCGTTAMGYLLAHRLRVAQDMLTHTGMSLAEIARATGFGYDTYFIKQFTQKRGMTPTQFRDASRAWAQSV